MTIVCGDSHTSTHGAFAALAFGIGPPVAARLVTESLKSDVEPTRLARGWVVERIARSAGQPRKTFAPAMAETRSLLAVF
jgi:hypothetical protein